MSTIGTSPDWVQSLDFLMSRLQSGLGLEKIQISVLKLKIWKTWKVNSKNRKIWKKKENLERNLKIWRIAKIFNFSNFQIWDSKFWIFRILWFFRIFRILWFISNFSNFRFQFSSFSILKLKFEFCPDPVQIRIWFWSGPDKIQIWVWTWKIPDSGLNLD